VTVPPKILPPSRATVKRGGRPKIEISLKLVQDCLEAGFTEREIAAHCGIKVETLRKRAGKIAEMRELIEDGPHLRRRALKLLQWAKARQGNVPMLIHLGKAELGQADGAPPAAGASWLVEVPATLTPEQWAEQYGPMRGIPKGDDDAA
jgi:hypothetical protein